MNKTLHPVILMFLLLNVIVAACSAVPTLQPATETSTPRPVPSQTPTFLPTATATITPTPEFAPYCEPGTTNSASAVACELPIAVQSSTFCENKKPYNLIYMNEGATYEVLTKNFQCTDAGMKNDKQLVTCTGPMAMQFSVEVCDPACAPPIAEAQVTQCPEGYFYNQYQGCCTQEIQIINQNCELLLLETKSCLIDCGVYKKKSACDKNSFACTWDDDENVCVLRR